MNEGWFQDPTREVKHLKANLSPPRIVIDKCIGCGRCISVCPSFVIDFIAEKAAVTRRNWCIGCGQCEEVCPQQIRVSAAMSDFAAKVPQ